MEHKTRLEDLRPQTTIRGILPDAQVTVVQVQWFGSEALELIYKDPDGHAHNRFGGNTGRSPRRSSCT
jgi:hypothetical protein